MKYLLLYKGPATPPGASHDGWPQWFSKTAEALVDAGSRLDGGDSFGPDGHQVPTELDLNGFSIVEASDLDELREVIASHPYLGLSPDHTIEAFEAPNR